MNGEKILDSIKVNQHPRFNTLYCTEEQLRALVDTIATPHTKARTIRTDEFKIFGLDVIVMDTIERPIMCEKGDVFPLTKGYD